MTRPPSPELLVLSEHDFSLPLTSRPLPAASMPGSQGSICDFWSCPSPTPQIFSSKPIASYSKTLLSMAPCPSLSCCPRCSPVCPAGNNSSTRPLRSFLRSLPPSFLSPWMFSYRVTIPSVSQARELGVASAPSQGWFPNPLFTPPLPYPIPFFQSPLQQPLTGLPPTAQKVSQNFLQLLYLSQMSCDGPQRPLHALSPPPLCSPFLLLPASPQPAASRASKNCSSAHAHVFTDPSA